LLSAIARISTLVGLNIIFGWVEPLLQWNYFYSFTTTIRDLKENKFQNFLYIFDGIYSGLTQTSIVTLMTFTSDLVRREINGYLLGIKNNGNIGFIFK
jgi:hypothetical protein